MRKVAPVKIAVPECARCIMYACEDGVFVFPCATNEDVPATGDYWFQSIDEAENFCHSEYGIRSEDWTVVNDPLPGCQDDWISPVQIKGRDNGAPEWGKFERLENGKWVGFEPNTSVSGEYDR